MGIRTCSLPRSPALSRSKVCGSEGTPSLLLMGRSGLQQDLVENGMGPRTGPNIHNDLIAKNNNF